MSRRRKLLLAGFGVVAVALVCLAWVVVRGLLARQHLLKARDEVSQLRAEVADGDLSHLRTRLAVVQSNADAAQSLTSDPIWSAVSRVPLLGRTLDTSGGLAAAVDHLAKAALPPVVDAADGLDPTTVRKPDGSVDLSRLSAAEPKLVAAQTELQATRQSLVGLPHRFVLPPVSSALDQLSHQLDSLIGSVDVADRAARVGPAMLGAGGERRYLVMFQTPAESRGTGGLPGSYAVIRVVNGKVTREQTGSDDDLHDATTPVASPSPEYAANYASAGGLLGWKAANLTAHYPWAAQVWSELWTAQTGQHIDGVIAVDPIALGYLLSVTGPVRLSDGETITADNAAHWTMVDSYARYADDNARRKQLSVELARITLDKLSNGAGHSTKLLEVLGRAAGERRLLLWSAQPNEQSAISGTPLAGEVPDNSQPFASLVVYNASGDKLDYYLQRQLEYRTLSCDETTRRVQITATVTNTAPPGLPPYVSGRSDGRHVPYGQDRLIIELFTTKGGTIEASSVDGRPQQVYGRQERGHPVFLIDQELPIGQPQTLQVVVREPRSSQPAQILVQPLAQPEQVSFAGSC